MSQERVSMGLGVRLLVVTLGLATAMPAVAHFPWIVPPKQGPAIGEPLRFRIGYGHDFPEGSALPNQRIGEVSLMAPNGGRVALEAHNEGFVSAPLKAEGAYVAAVSQKRNYYTRTAEEGIRAPKNEVTGALHCSYSGNAMKAIIGSGDSQSLTTAFGHPLEIIPLTPPSAEGMRVRLLYRNQPQAAELELISGTGEARTVSTGADGTADLPLDSGEWLVVANVQADYPDKSKCDAESFTATLSFGVR